MFAKRNSFCTSLAVWIAFTILGAMVVFPVSAQDNTPPPDPGCFSCHEDLYQLHDTGKAFCLCQESMRCTCCHGGDPQSNKAEEAHAGMVLYPTRDNASTCQKCHPDDYLERVEQFITVAGVSELHPGVPTITPQAQTGQVSSALAYSAPLERTLATVGIGVDRDLNVFLDLFWLFLLENRLQDKKRSMIHYKYMEIKI